MSTSDQAEFDPVGRGLPPRTSGWCQQRNAPPHMLVGCRAGMVDSSMRVGSMLPGMHFRRRRDPQPVRLLSFVGGSDVVVPAHWRVWRWLLPDSGADAVAGVVNRNWRTFESPLPESLLAIAGITGGAFYDVGANTGFYCILMSKAWPSRIVRAFEPVPGIADICAANIEVNQVAVDLERIALSEQAGEVRIFLPTNTFGLVETSASLDPDFKCLLSALRRSRRARSMMSATATVRSWWA